VKFRKLRKKTPSKTSPLPTVDLSQPLPVLAETIGKILKDAPIYRQGNKIVTVTARGKVERMTPERFTQWIKSYMTFTLPSQDPIAVEIAVKEMCRSTLILPS